jgi:hypothetical protein
MYDSNTKPDDSNTKPKEEDGARAGAAEVEHAMGGRRKNLHGETEDEGEADEG